MKNKIYDVNTKRSIELNLPKRTRELLGYINKQQQKKITLPACSNAKPKSHNRAISDRIIRFGKGDFRKEKKWTNFRVKI